MKASTSENEKYHAKSGNLEGSNLRAGTLDQPKLEIIYENINKDKFTSTYNIELENRADGKYNIGNFTNPDFKEN